MLFMLLLLCGCALGSGDFTAKTKDLASKTMVVKGGEAEPISGSAFAFEVNGDTYIATARHVAIGIMYTSGLEIQFCSSLDPKSCVFQITTMGFTYTSDLPTLDTIVWKVEEVPSGVKVSKTNCNPRVGEKVFAGGAPFGRAPDISQGYVTWKSMGLIIHDARTAPGSSGGPLFNRRGQVVGQSIAVETIGSANVSSSSVALDICTVIDLAYR